MKVYKEIDITEQRIIAKICDKCGLNVNFESAPYEFQEFHHINFTGGYGSVFGDEDRIECDLCQYCLKEMIDGIYRIDGEKI